MSQTKLRSIRLPSDLAQSLEQASQAAGMSCNAFVVAMLRAHLEQFSAEQAWLAEVRTWLLATYRPSDFPPEATRLVFHHIRDTPALRTGYEALIRDATGAVDAQRRADLHKEIGRMVKQSLQARVIGRVVDLDPRVHLIRTHALLGPGDTTES